MSTECLFSDKCKGAALCPSSDDACPSVAEARIEQLTTERDQARHKLAEAVEALRDLTDTVIKITLPRMMVNRGATDEEQAVYDHARAIVARHAGAESEREKP